MAKAKKDSASSGAGKKKKKSVKLGEGIKLKVKLGAKGKKRGAGKPGKGQAALDGIARLIESPLVADLIAIGATAAVAAIAAGMSDKPGTKARSSAKNAGKAAAGAMGRRLMDEFSAIKEAGKNAKAKAK